MRRLSFPCFFQLFLLFISVSNIDGNAQSKLNLAEFAGRYTDDKEYVVYFEMTRFGLTIRPVLWTATQLLRSTGSDSFEVVDRPNRGADFITNSKDEIVGVKIRGMEGEDLLLHRAVEPLLPVELLLKGQPSKAADAFRSRGGKEGEALEIAKKVYQRIPTKRRYVVSFLNKLRSELGKLPEFYSLLGNAQVAIGDRSDAKLNFLRAYALDPASEEAVSALARLDALPRGHRSDKQPWRLPFSLSDVFTKPTAAEIKAVEDDWASRNLMPKGVREEARGDVRVDDWSANVHVYSYLVHGFRNYGAVIIPKNAAANRCPVIVDAKGVSPTYFPLDIEKIESIRMMGDLKDRFIYVVPSFRGEILNFGGKSYTSEGDRRDALDGATDDTIAFVNVALQTTSEADPKRICVFGHSRGGTVAMLAGIRDKRINCVVNVAGPVDWFYAMGTDGWTEQELWQEGVRIHASPLETGGQNLERFMGRAFEGKADLAAVRHNMIASSPLYFAKRLPPGQHYYGVEDISVPVRNAYGLKAALPRAKRASVFIYSGQGHDTDRIEMPHSAEIFIAKTLGVN